MDFNISTHFKTKHIWINSTEFAAYDMKQKEGNFFISMLPEAMYQKRTVHLIITNLLNNRITHEDTIVQLSFSPLNSRPAKIIGYSYSGVAGNTAEVIKYSYSDKNIGGIRVLNCDAINRCTFVFSGSISSFSDL